MKKSELQKIIREEIKNILSERRPGEPMTSHKGVPDWFNDMAPKAQKEYVAKHPHSKPAMAMKNIDKKKH